ncbi:Down syndrome cell adhesion molecule homolog [Limulus polyphemus]|uniref:Down syndrome cell adhesion molecule homolog n=1 Tax=Limulus polyphemus TaxID=6850 RepID=A0ABM1RZZ8_LIMPO|nr:Down syndrome cell adhesion molecule homolog [Limulus polyphemus]
MFLKSLLVFCVRYQRIVCNELDITYQKFVMSSYTEPPILQPSEFPSDIELGSRVQIMCYLKKGDLPVTFTWNKDGKQLLTNERVTVSSLDTFTSNLRIQRVISEDVANYSCTAANSAGSDSFTAALIVRAPPFWKQQPENTVQAIIATRTLIGCSVGGYPAPRVTWKIKNPSGSFTPVSRSYKMKVLDNGTLVINDVKETDSGTYLCQADNGVGEKLEKAVRLSVHGNTSYSSGGLESPRVFKDY